MTALPRRLGVASLLAVLLTLMAGATGFAAPRTTAGRAALPLGAADLTEVRNVATLQPGVTLTTVVRGAVDPADFWTVEINIPATSTSPDPDAPSAALSDRASAQALAHRVSAAGFQPRVEQVTAPPTADYNPGTLGWRVRVGRLATKADSDALLARLVAAGFAGSSRFTGWDPSPIDRGPWRLQVLTIDPHRFSGRLVTSFGPNLEDRETTSALSRALRATAGTNGGYFVLDPSSGAPGDPAGVGVYGGRLLSETVNGRPGLILHDDARRTTVERLHWVGTATGSGHQLLLDGIDRVPGLIRNCGGRGDTPTDRPLHDFTCTDPGELVAFTTDFGPTTPAGPGLEAVLDTHSRVVALSSPRGGRLPAGYRAVQATGDQVAGLRQVAVPGTRLALATTLLDGSGRVVRPNHATSMVNGGPVLVANGRLHVTPQRDGFVRPTSPSTYYGFSAERNPRTFAGVDRSGRTVIATADGRSTASLGLSITETAAVARALGMVDAMNLDGGGSTTMVVHGQVTNDPSDATGERPVGDALLVLPR